MEEAVVNALYHRDYKVREPVEITIEPDKISILSYSGPDRSISITAIKEARSLISRRYRNRRLGEFLKENERSYFLIDIPCHPYWTQAKAFFKSPLYKALSNRQKTIIKIVQENPYITQKEMAEKTNVSRQTISKDILHLFNLKIIYKDGLRKKGVWIISLK